MRVNVTVPDDLWKSLESLAILMSDDEENGLDPDEMVQNAAIRSIQQLLYHLPSDKPGSPLCEAGRPIKVSTSLMKFLAVDDDIRCRPCLGAFQAALTKSELG